ncbi:MAG: HlyD family secretion protein [Bacteroidetes bacterium HGW-Bacteroidetes-6]|jgi:HlyD family secretion protein|nr:MAG: HlyD family secretion protein [Bacteroidetes bacterium HGW-Bacteroidetes-6]
MKKYIFLLSLPLVLLSCGKSNEEADAYGNFESDEIIVSSEVSGKIINMQLEEGDVLNEGDVIAVIDTVPLVLKLDVLMAQRRAVMSRTGNVSTSAEVLIQQKSNLQKELERVDKLLSDGAATQKQKDDIVYQISVIDRQIANVRSQGSPIGAEAGSVDAQIEQIIDQIQRSTITSPISATVLTQYLNEGEIAVAGKPLVKIANLKIMYLKAYVSGSQLSEVKLNQKVTVRIDNGEDGYKEYEGIVTWISQQAEFTPKIIQTKEERVNLVYAIKVKVINDGSVKIGMPGEVLFSSK